MVLLLTVFLLVFASCGSRPQLPKEDDYLKEAVKEYLASFEAEAADYFTELIKETTGQEAEEISIGFRSVTSDFLKAERKSLEALLTEENPVLLVGIVTASGIGYTEDEIHDMILELKERGIVLDLYFNHNDYYIYQIREDGVVIDKTSGKDGGAMHELIDYDL